MDTLIFRPDVAQVMGVPAFLLRKLYRKGSLREEDSGFSFTLQNPLADATVIAPPRFVVNGVAHEAADVSAHRLDLAGIDADHPFAFNKGTSLDLHFRGRLLRGGNRIHVEVETKEFETLEFLVEDRAETRPSNG